MSGFARDEILLGRYKVLELARSGGMASIYLGRDLKADRKVAIKSVRDDKRSDAAFAGQLQNEAGLLANLSHPNLVSVYASGLKAGIPFVVMEWTAGVDLKSMLRGRVPMDMDEGLWLMVQACEGVGYAHHNGIVHCDLKPQNMIVRADDTLQVTDFGLARRVTAVETRSPVVWGSPQYYAPEQAAGMAPTPASDVYSLGIVTYEVLTGRLPFTARTPRELARQHHTTQAIRPREYAPDLPTALEDAILTAMAKEPANRYRNASQFGQVLAQFLPKEAAHVPVAPKWSGQRRKSGTGLWKTLAWILVIGGAVLIALWMYLVYNPLVQ